MSTTTAYTALIRQDGPWWIGWVEEEPGVNAQEQSREALLESLREVLRESSGIQPSGRLRSCRPRGSRAFFDPVKRRDLLRYLTGHGCEQLREGGNHSWWWNPSRNLRSSIPRHSEIKEILVRKICKVLGLPPP